MNILAGLMIGLFALFQSPATATAGDIAVGAIIVEDPWARATPDGAKVGAGYLSLINVGSLPDKLLSVSSDIADRVELHTTSLADGVMRMRKIDDGLSVAAKAIVELKPGGIHLMFVNLKRPLREGESFNAQFKFEKAGEVDVLFLTTGIGGDSPYAKGGEEFLGSQSGAIFQQSN